VWHGFIESRFDVLLVGCKWFAILAARLRRIERGLELVVFQKGVENGEQQRSSSRASARERAGNACMYVAYISRGGRA